MTAASGADQPTLRDQLLDELSSWFHANVCPHIDDESDTWGGETCDDYAVALLPLIEADRERAKAEGGADALEQAADVLDTRAVQLWSAYKSASPDDPRRANPHTEGESDGWENAATHVRARAAALRDST